MQIRKAKHRLPTVDEFLRFVPKRLQIEWSINDEGLVELKVPKFTSKLGNSFCSLVRKDNVFSAKMDKIGSLVWQNCDGRNTVQDILKKLKKEYPKEENIDQRLFLFLQQMQSLHYLEL